VQRSPRPAGAQPPPPRHCPGACRLADYLEQHGRSTRRDRIPPEHFWYAAARHASPGDLPALAEAASNRGLLRDAARLRKRAAEHGDTEQAAVLIRDLHALNPAASLHAAQWAAGHASLDNPYAVANLLRALREAGADQQVSALLDRAAGHVSLDDPYAVRYLLEALREAGADQQVTALLDRAAGHVSLDDPYAVRHLLRAMREAGADQQRGTFISRLPAEGHFRLFLGEPGHEKEYRFGREPDGSPAPEWSWTDLS
jgi:hypothetical protein